jgi:GDPmannose 4,6-dehydratase
MKKNVIITGITGQDGAYLANFLLKKKKYNIYGVLRRNSTEPFGRLDYLGIKKYINFVPLDLSEHRQIDLLIKKLKPKFFFNLAAQSFVAYSFDNPFYTDYINNTSVINILESIRISSPKTKFYQASSSEMFGDVKYLKKKILNEDTKFNPVSPYAISKLSAYFYTRMYRSAYKIFASNGILFNHESPLRGEQFVTKKIVKGLVNFKKNGTPLYLGNLYSKRDWGDAEDYVEMMYKIMNINKPDDFVISTGESYSIKNFVNMVCKHINLPIKWVGSGLNERAVNTKHQTVVSVKKSLFRPHDVNYLLGDCFKARKYLHWKPKKIEILIKKMIQFEMNF